MREADERYFETLEARLDQALELAGEARGRGRDPSEDVEIPVAKDMADRVENILGIPGVAERVRELEGEMSREEAALALAKDFAEGTVGDYETAAGKVEGAVRTAVALLTEGVVAAPIEGIDRVELLQNDDGTEFVNVYYAGPIRSAGGTAQALSVLVADYARSLLDLAPYRAREAEVERYAEELNLYDEDTGLQYSPKDAETKFIAEHLPVMLDGESTGDEEVEGFRDLDRVDTNNPRGGMCLVLGEGIAQKAPKIQRYTRELDAVDWPWLEDLIEGTIGTEEGDDGEGDAEDEGSDADADDGADGEHAAPDGPPRADPSKKFLRDLIAGRPVFSHPSEAGGFRLRYGRARNHGFATAGVHPATMHLVDDFLATGTQVKTERPGKAAGIVPVDTIEGPTVKLANGDVRRIDDAEEALAVRNGVEAILDLGEYLVNFGEFVENNHPLVPAGYTVEWWVKEFDAAGVDVQALEDSLDVDLQAPDERQAIEWAREHDAPLHPTYTYCWHDVSVEQFEALADAVAEGRLERDADATAADDTAADGTAADGPATDGGAVAAGEEGVLVIERTPAVREALEALLVEHTQNEDELRVPEWRALALSLGLDADRERTWEDLSAAAREWDGGDNAVEAVNEVAPFEVRERAPTRVGNRMGRPEKSEKRELSPAVHALFPIGEAGGAQRSVAEAAQTGDDVEGTRGHVEVEVGTRACNRCGTRTWETACPDCDGHTEPHYNCPDCGQVLEPDEAGRVHCDRCEVDGTSVATRTVDVREQYRDALEAVGERENVFDVLKGVKGLSSAHKTPEPLEKGVLRAKNDVSAFKDGTVRYDMTDLPVTAVRPEELSVTADQLRQLGYEQDVHGDPLQHDDQLVELKVQDVVLSDGAAEHMLRTADFVDDLLVEYYDMEPFYEVDDREELVGELVFGMAPHTSAAVVGRVVGFTTAAVGYAHPYFHAAKRRNCFHPDTKVWYEDEAGDWHHERIETLVEERIEDPRTDDFGTLVQELDGDVRVPSVDEDGDTVLKPVEAVSKHRSPDHLVRVETRSGREVTVTPDHGVLRWQGEQVERIEAHELDAGDELPPGLGDRQRGDDGPAAVAADGGDPEVEVVEQVQYVPSDVEYTYCLTVAETHTLYANGVPVQQCDGDEDCVMLLMDGLLNFSKEYLPDKRGGSVAEDSRLVAVSPDGEVTFTTFGEFWDGLGSEITRDGKFRKKTCLSEGWQTYAFDDEHEASLRPIEKAIRYPADEDETLLRVETQFGRSLDITPHHSLFRYDDDIEEVAGDELEEGDLVVAPRELDVDPVETTVDVAEVIDEPYVFIDDHVEDLLTTVWESTDHGGDAHDEFMRGLAYRLAKNKIGYERFGRILDAGGFEGVPEDVTVGVSGSETGIDRTLEVDEAFGWLLGLFVAEGTLSSVNPCIHNGDEDIVDRAVEVTEDTLGVEPETRWSNRAYEVRFPKVFEAVLHDLGFVDAESYESSEKVVPDCILRAPREVVLSFLRGFVAGDGSDSSDDNVTTVGFHTTSDDVKDGIVFLLHRLGLVANVSTKTDREGNRQDIHTVTVSGGAEDNPLHRILDGEEPYHPKSLVVSIPDALMEIREMDVEGVKQVIPKYLKRRENVSLEKLREIAEELETRDLPAEARDRLDELRPLVDGDLAYLRVQDVEEVDYDGYLYDLQVGGEPIFTADWLYAHNSMDAPLVMSSRIDPTEIDDEAHNMDVVTEYPLELYEASRELAEPGEVDVQIAEDTLGTDRQYSGFEHTHDTSDIAAGPDLSAYKTLGSMMDKMDAQLELARKLRAVDETDVAERVIEYHFLPDLLGNLRAFSSQEVRCLDCGEKYRRMPLSSDCRECGGDMTLTVHEGSVNKYMDVSLRVAEEYGAGDYTIQRLEILQKSLESLFENDKNRRSTLGEFM